MGAKLQSMLLTSTMAPPYVTYNITANQKWLSVNVFTDAKVYVDE